MIIAIPAETAPGEPRAATTPNQVRRFVALGAAVRVESGIGAGIGLDDGAYREAGAELCPDATALLTGADLVVRLRRPPEEHVRLLRPGCIHISFLDPFREPALIRALALAGVSAISMEMIPRTTAAQKMDALSSQANLAGYAAVVLAASRCPRIFPMMMTAAGTLTPATVFVLGAGVAGLQAIATARRLGARVTAFDVRPSSQTEVESLGARFLRIDIGPVQQTASGYAVELTPEQKQKQREGQAKAISASDVVITAAQVFGRKAPVLVTDAMLAAMRPGSVVVDTAIDSGGNVEDVQPGESVRHGVLVLAPANLPGRVAVHASDMYASNVASLVEHFWDPEAAGMRIDAGAAIMAECLVTHAGAVVNPKVIQSAAGG